MHEAPIDRLCDIITHLSQNPRPPRSAEELAAARYIQEQLELLDVESIEELPFFSIGRMSERVTAAGLLAGAGMLIGAADAKWRRITGALLVLAAALSAREILKGQAPPWEALWPQRRSQNIVGRIAAGQDQRERVVLLAHLDTDLQRLTARPEIREYAPYLYAGLPNTALLGTILTLLNAPSWLKQLLAYALFGGAGLSVANELGASTTGANDNGAGVAMLLALAEQLAKEPLDHTEVVLAFTGCGTVAGQGAAEIVKQYGDEWRDALWLSVDNIGAGELCWVTSHGWSNTIRYKPHPEVHDRLTRIASANPHLGIMGRPMTTLDDVAPLRDANLKAAAIMGYERASGIPKHWQQDGDTADQIEPDTLSRTWEFLWAILRDIDG